MAGNIIMSRAEAEGVMEESWNKDFWSVDVEDNFERLQAAIDVIYNSIEGNKYEVIYQENQNSTRIAIYCGICEKELSSYTPFKTHESGKLHKKVRQQKLTIENPNLIAKLKRRFMNEPKRYFSEGSLENMIDSATNVSILGVHFVYKETIKGQDSFTCQLCQNDADVTRLPKEAMFEHLSHHAHNKKYMEVKFGYKKENIDDFVGEAKFIEEYEGRIHHNIIDFTNQLPPDLLQQNEAPEELDELKRQKSGSPEGKDRTPSPDRSKKSPGMDMLPDTPPGSDVDDPEFALPSTAVAEVQADFSENPRPWLDALALLEKDEVREQITEDAAMQALVIQAMSVLNAKLERYYHHTNATLNDAGKEFSLVESTRKVRDYIKMLKPL